MFNNGQRAILIQSLAILSDVLNPPKPETCQTGAMAQTSDSIGTAKSDTLGMREGAGFVGMKAEDDAHYEKMLTLRLEEQIKRNGLQYGIIQELRAKNTELVQMHEKQVGKLQNLVDIQCTDGNWDVDEYMRGMANGLLVAIGVFNGSETTPPFKSAIPQKVTTTKPGNVTVVHGQMGIHDFEFMTQGPVCQRDYDRAVLAWIVEQTKA